VIDLFREWDEDGDGEISKAEFARALPLMGINPPRDQFDLLFDAFDADGGGSISFREFNKQLKQTPGGKSSLAQKNSKAAKQEEEEPIVSISELKSEVAREVSKLKPKVDPLLASMAMAAPERFGKAPMKFYINLE
jgi:hypothetical protein